MEIKDIIFNLLKSYPHTWVRYWMAKEPNGTLGPGEYVEIRSSFLHHQPLREFFEAGFKIESINSQKINADSYCDILLKREIKNNSL